MTEAWEDDDDPYITTFSYKTDSIIMNSIDGNAGWAVDATGLTNAMVPYVETDHNKQIDFEYDNQKCLIKESSVDKSFDYEYDNKTGISAHINMNMWQAVLLHYYDDMFNYFLFRQNNISKITDSTNTGSGPVSYEYNSEGYPTKMTFKKFNGITVVREFEYMEVK